ncbi:MAG: hypothetical protein JWR16_1249 [Nevskia sp.]|nr:hypothetical protein [Nevskia sp.]
MRLRMAGAAVITAVGVGLLCGPEKSIAFQFDTGPDWTVHWDNTVQYNLGMRVKSIDDGIGNNPAYAENEYKFSSAGDIVTNRLSLMSEFDTVYNGGFGTAGFRVSGSGFRDFAYDDKVKTHPGDVAPQTPYSAVGSYKDGHYTGYTKKYYVAGGQLLDAFVFGNFSIAGHAASFKLGRFTQYWGNALFFGDAGINYSQNASDNIKGAAAPGTQAKELAIPRTQALMSTQITPDLSIEAQYFLEFQGNRLPEGGTYLGVTGFLFDGPDTLFGAVPHGPTFKPNEVNSNFGVKMAWAPAWLRGSAGVYYRHLDEVQPWAPLFGVDPATGTSNYHLAYAKNVDMFGLSLDKQLGDFSTGFEISYRRNTALNSATGPLPSDLAGTEGARGDTLNVVANILSGLTPTPLWQTGSVLGEIVYTHKIDVTENKALYNGTSNASGCPTHDRWDGCSTNDAISVAGLFDPTWLQVISGVDLDMPIFAMFGVYGNTASLGAPVNQGVLNYTGGFHALVRARYNVTLQYNGYSARTNGGLTNFATANGTPVPVGTPGFPSYYASGNGTYFYNDKDWLSLTVQFAF